MGSSQPSASRDSEEAERAPLLPGRNDPNGRDEDNDSPSADTGPARRSRPSSFVARCLGFILAFGGAFAATARLAFRYNNNPATIVCVTFYWASVLGCVLLLVWEWSGRDDSPPLCQHCKQPYSSVLSRRDRVRTALPDVAIAGGLYVGAVLDMIYGLPWYRWEVTPGSVSGILAAALHVTLAVTRSRGRHLYIHLIVAHRDIQSPAVQTHDEEDSLIDHRAVDTDPQA